MKWLFLLLRLGRFIADTFSTFSPSRLVPSVGLFHHESRNLQLLSYLLAGTWRDLLVPDIRRSDCAHSVVWTRKWRWNDQMSNVFWADCRPARMFLPTAGTALNGLRWRIRIVPLERGFHPRLHALNAFQWQEGAVLPQLLARVREDETNFWHFWPTKLFTVPLSCRIYFFKKCHPQQ